jgi:hypothetical protein
MKIAYKAVAWHGSLYFESWTPAGRSTFIHYIPGHIVRRPILAGPLACFERAHQAAHFLGYNGDVEGLGSELILRVEVIKRSAETALYLHPDDYHFKPSIAGTIFVDELQVIDVLHPRYVVKVAAGLDRRYETAYPANYELWLHNRSGFFGRGGK